MSEHDEGPPQLTIEGGEVSSARARHTSSTAANPAFTEAQRTILARLGEQGYIRSVEAGRIVHECRGTRCARFGGERAGALREGSLGCCAYASADGLAALKRLEARGLVTGDGAGRWTPPE